MHKHLILVLQIHPTLNFESSCNIRFFESTIILGLKYRLFLHTNLMPKCLQKIFHPLMFYFSHKCLQQQLNGSIMLYFLCLGSGFITIKIFTKHLFVFCTSFYLTLFSDALKIYLMGFIPFVWFRKKTQINPSNLLKACFPYYTGRITIYIYL